MTRQTIEALQRSVSEVATTLEQSFVRPGNSLLSDLQLVFTTNSQEQQRSSQTHPGQKHTTPLQVQLGVQTLTTAVTTIQHSATLAQELHRTNAQAELHHVAQLLTEGKERLAYFTKWEENPTHWVDVYDQGRLEYLEVLLETAKSNLEMVYTDLSRRDQRSETRRTSHVQQILDHGVYYRTPSGNKVQLTFDTAAVQTALWQWLLYFCKGDHDRWCTETDTLLTYGDNHSTWVITVHDQGDLSIQNVHDLTSNHQPVETTQQEHALLEELLHRASALRKEIHLAVKSLKKDVADTIRKNLCPIPESNLTDLLAHTLKDHPTIIWAVDDIWAQYARDPWQQIVAKDLQEKLKSGPESNLISDFLRQWQQYQEATLQSAGAPH